MMHKDKGVQESTFIKISVDKCDATKVAYCYDARYNIKLYLLQNNIFNQFTFIWIVCIEMKASAFFSKCSTFGNKITYRNHIP